MHVIFNKEQIAISFCSNEWESEMKTEVAYISKMLLTIYKTVRCHIPELTKFIYPDTSFLHTCN